ncbi:MAG TPA: biopolymer transporter ExbD [Terracidiphilus sp.]|jgi:biopolymer transport protein ExbD
MTMDNADMRSMQSEINVTPMIDVLLVLLIIFMVIVPLAPRGESASVPQPATQGTPQLESTVVLEILKSGQNAAIFRINQQEIQLRDLRAKLAEIYANRAQRVLFIKADDQLSFSEVAEAMDISHAAGIERVGLMTPKAMQGL